METVLEALGGVAEGRVGRPTGQRVHRYTRTARGQERAFWQPFNPKDKARYLAAAEKYDRVQRQRDRHARNGRKNGTLGHIGLDVLRELLRLVDYRTGQLDPALATIAKRIGRSIAAVVEALKRLKAHGFLDWLRRYVPTGNAGLRGPQVKQTSNAYRLMLPEALLRCLNAPPPEDDGHRRETAAEEGRAMIAALPLQEQPAQLVDDPSLAATLAWLGAAIDRRERDSGGQNESDQS